MGFAQLKIVAGLVLLGKVREVLDCGEWGGQVIEQQRWGVGVWIVEVEGGGNLEH